MIQSVTYSVILCSIVLCSMLVFMVEKTPVASFYRWMLRSFGKSREEPVNDAVAPELPAISR